MSESHIRRVLVLGAGQMGAGIAQASAEASCQVIVWVRNPTGRERGRARLERNLNSVVSSGFRTERQAARARSLIRFTEQLEPAAGEVDLAIETVAEDLEIKQALFRRLDGACPSHTILATDTSALSISALADATHRPQKVVGTHFWNPPHLMPIVEVVRAANTSEDTLAETRAFVQNLGKMPVLVKKDVPGFIGNRMLHALWREAINIVERGIAEPEDVDLVATLTFGLRSSVLGPIANMDLVGLDLLDVIHESLLPDLAGAPQPSLMVKQYVAEGRTGMKAGLGILDWEKHDPEAAIAARDAEVMRQLQRLRAEGILPVAPAEA